MELTQISINWWLDKEIMVLIHNGILHICKKKEWNPVFCSKMDVSGDYYAY